MARRAPVNETPYRPLLDVGLVNAAVLKTTTVAPQRPIEQKPSQTTNVAEIARPEAAPEPKAGDGASVGEGRPNVLPLIEKMDQEKRILLTKSEAASLERVVNSLATRLNVQLKQSHVCRALIALLLNAETQLDRRAGEAPPLVRPPNGDAKAMDRFEKDIARVILASFRDAGGMT